METTIDRIARELKGKIFIQGGSHRMDLGPRRQEIESFRLAIELFRRLKGNGGEVCLGCLVNDLALDPIKRPKNSGIRYELPKEYLEMLDKLPDKLDVTLFWESSLRNKARKGPDNALKHNTYSGNPVATCPAIMGTFYKSLEKAGYDTIIGFYPFEESCGPVKGTDFSISGYVFGIKILSYFPYKDKLIEASEFLNL